MLRCVPLAVRASSSSSSCFLRKQQGLTQGLKARGLGETWRRSQTIPQESSLLRDKAQTSSAPSKSRPHLTLGEAPPGGGPLAAGEEPPAAAARWEQRQRLHFCCRDVQETRSDVAEAATATVGAVAAAMTTAAATAAAATAATAAATAAAATRPYTLRLRNIFRWGGVAAVSAHPAGSSSSSSSGLVFTSWGVRTPQDWLKDPTLGRAAAAIREAVEDCALLLWKGNKWRGTWVPNKWKWYHRHGYWATRKKLLKFDTYRRYRYHEVKGLGQPKAKWWAPNTHKSPLSQATKFW